MKLKYRNITVSGKIATGTSTLAMSLQQILGWKYINIGEMQRKYNRERGIPENENGSTVNSDEHERQIENFTKETLRKKDHIIYEAWLSGYVARDIPGTFKVLLVCRENSVRVDRVVNRDKYTVEQAKHFIAKREEENIIKWTKIYGEHDFWDPQYYNIVIDTFSSGPMETLGKVLDKIGYSKK